MKNVRFVGGGGGLSREDIRYRPPRLSPQNCEDQKPNVSKKKYPTLRFPPSFSSSCFEFSVLLVVLHFVGRVEGPPGALTESEETKKKGK